MDVKLHLKGKNDKLYEFTVKFNDEEFEMLAQVGLHHMIENGLYKPEIPEDIKELLQEEHKIHILEVIPNADFYEA